jgi:murein DD-endopeptidase MepM/ murein hydrolase activator NlpD
MTNPCPGYTITTPFGKPGSWAAGYHTGDDYAAPTGARVVAAAAGSVVANRWDASYGWYVELDSAGVRHRYCHLAQQSSARIGTAFGAGQQVGQVGSTGNSTGPHLHYEERVSPYGYHNHRRPQYNHGTAPPTDGEDDPEMITDQDLDRIANAVWSLQLTSSNSQAAHTVLREGRDLARQARDLADSAPARTLNWALDMGGGATTAAWAVLKGAYENTVQLLR